MRIEEDDVMEQVKETFEKTITVHTIRTDNENCTHEVGILNKLSLSLISHNLLYIVFLTVLSPILI